MNIATEEVSSGCGWGSKVIGHGTRSSNHLSCEYGLSSAGVGINGKVMDNTTIHIVEINGYLGPMWDGDRTHVKGNTLSYQVDGYRSTGN